MNKKVILFIVASVVFSGNSFCQDVISQEKEYEVMVSGEYYAEYGFGMTVEEAKNQAMESLVNTIVTNAVSSTLTADEILHEITLNAHVGRLENEGQNCIIAWIHKDSVFVTVSKSLPRHEQRKPEDNDNPWTTESDKKADVNDMSHSQSTLPSNLLECEDFNEFRRVIVKSGYIYGDINSTAGFADPTNCFIAIFNRSGKLEAVLDKGDSTRMNLLTGTAVDNPVEYYTEQDFLLWYFSK